MERKTVVIAQSDLERQKAVCEQIREYWLAQGRTPLAFVDTYGCQQNEADSERIRGMLQSCGYQLSDTEEGADCIVINTCAIREHAETRVYGNVGALVHTKARHPGQKIFLCGCMMGQPAVADRIKKSYRHVDGVFNPHQLWRFPELLQFVLAHNKRIFATDDSAGNIAEGLPVVRTSDLKAWVSIMYGCNNFCSYCIVPYVRGRERSRKPEDIIKEIEKLAADGVTEVMLLGQNVNSYGKNLETPMTFAELLREVEKIDGIRRIRFMTSHPKDLSDELIQVMKESRKICRHLHLPLQSGSSRILKAMNRRYTKEQYLELAEKIRREIPDISLTTDIIVGFPGETDEDFEETLDVVRKVHYDNAYTFIYSRRTGTPAASMENQVSEADNKVRFDKLLKLVQGCAREQTARYTGTVQEVLIEEVNDHRPGYVTGRMSNNLLVHFPGEASQIGQYVNVSLDECKGFYFMGTIV